MLQAGKGPKKAWHILGTVKSSVAINQSIHAVYKERNKVEEPDQYLDREFGFYQKNDGSH